MYSQLSTATDATISRSTRDAEFFVSRRDRKLSPDWRRSLPAARYRSSLCPDCDLHPGARDCGRGPNGNALFLTDSEPLDHDWEQTFKATLAYNPVTNTGMRQYPAFIPFGFRDAPDNVSRSWPTRPRGAGGITLRATTSDRCSRPFSISSRTRWSPAGRVRPPGSPRLSTRPHPPFPV
jgi:hypothetical protein